MSTINSYSFHLSMRFMTLILYSLRNFLQQRKFRYENLKAADKNYYFSTFDLKNGYQHIGIHRDDKKYLGFYWLCTDGRVRYFQFIV